MIMCKHTRMYHRSNRACLKTRTEPSGTGCVLVSAGGRAQGGGGEIGQLGERDALLWRKRRRKRRELLATRDQLERGRERGKEGEGGGRGRREREEQWGGGEGRGREKVKGYDKEPNPSV